MNVFALLISFLFLGRKMREIISSARGPEILITPRADAAGKVARAAMVSLVL